MVLISLCAAIAIAGCGGGDDSSTESSAAGTTAEVDTSKKPEVEVPEGSPPKQLAIKDLVKGTGAVAKDGDEVTVQYVGVGYESEEEFDSSWSRNEPFTFQLGSSQVIPGWDQGVKGMRVGGRRELIVPPDLAYGEAGVPPDIGPNETLVFVVDLVEVN